LTNGTTTGNTTTANATATANSTLTNLNNTTNGAALINSTCTDTCRVIDENHMLFTDKDSVACLRQGKYELVLNQDGSLSLTNLETGVKSWTTAASKNGVNDAQFKCAIGGGKFSCFSGADMVEYWSTNTSINDGYAQTKNLRVTITTDGKIDASVLYIQERVLISVDGRRRSFVVERQ
jgi:WD40 repeat protein